MFLSESTGYAYATMYWTSDNPPGFLINASSTIGAGPTVGRQNRPAEIRVGCQHRHFIARNSLARTVIRIELLQVALIS